MGNPEVIASSGNLLHTTLEARSALADINLLHTLQALGHPYGLFLNQTASIGQSSLLSSVSSYGSSNSSDVAATHLSATPLSAFLSEGSKIYDGSLDWSAENLFLLSNSRKPSPNETDLSSETSSVLSGQLCLPLSSLYSLSTSNEESEELSNSSKEYLLSSFKYQKENRSNFSINKHNLSLGTVSINLNRYHGQEPFVVRTTKGEPVIEIQSGNPLAFLHLNRQSAKLRQMSPLERIQTMTKNLKEVFGLIDNPELFNDLKPEQQAVLTAAQSAVIIGISHLVPLFRRRTGLPFWKLDVLPQAVQQLHRLDSQAVSNQFGGHRQVRVEDVEMMVITPQMRQQLATVYA